VGIFLPTDENLKKAIAVLKNSGIIAYPTETFYGLGTNPLDESAVKRLFDIKGRDFDKPVSILVKDLNALSLVAEEIPPAAERLIKRFWPGPLTIVFRAKKNIPLILTANTGRIGVRVSSSPIAKRLLGIIDMPLTATSANPSGEKSPVTAEEVEIYFRDKVDMILDGGKLQGKVGSTIIDATTGRDLECIREGDIPFAVILEYCKNLS